MTLNTMTANLLHTIQALTRTGLSPADLVWQGAILISQALHVD